MWSLDTIIRYLKDIAFDISPFGPVRRFFQGLNPGNVLVNLSAARISFWKWG